MDYSRPHGRATERGCRWRCACDRMRTVHRVGVALIQAARSRTSSKLEKRAVVSTCLSPTLNPKPNPSFDLLTSGSMQANGPPWTRLYSLPTLVLIAQAVLERVQIDRGNGKSYPCRWVRPNVLYFIQSRRRLSITFFHQMRLDLPLESINVKNIFMFFVTFLRFWRFFYF